MLFTSSACSRATPASANHLFGGKPSHRCPLPPSHTGSTADAFAAPVASPNDVKSGEEAGSVGQNGKATFPDKESLEVLFAQAVDDSATNALATSPPLHQSNGKLQSTPIALAALQQHQLWASASPEVNNKSYGSSPPPGEQELSKKKSASEEAGDNVGSEQDSCNNNNDAAIAITADSPPPSMAQQVVEADASGAVALLRLVADYVCSGDYAAAQKHKQASHALAAAAAAAEKAAVPFIPPLVRGGATSHHHPLPSQTMTPGFFGGWGAQPYGFNMGMGMGLQQYNGAFAGRYWPPQHFPMRGDMLLPFQPYQPFRWTGGGAPFGSSAFRAAVGAAVDPITGRKLKVKAQRKIHRYPYQGSAVVKRKVGRPKKIITVQGEGDEEGGEKKRRYSGAGKSNSKGEQLKVRRSGKKKSVGDHSSSGAYTNGDVLDEANGDDNNNNDNDDDDDLASLISMSAASTSTSSSSLASGEEVSEDDVEEEEAAEEEGARNHDGLDDMMQTYRCERKMIDLRLAEITPNRNVFLLDF